MRRVTMLLGAGFVAFGGFLLVDNSTWASVRAALTWFLGGVVVHDGLLVPLTLLLGAVLARVLPDRYRGLVQGALVVSAMVTIALLPLLSGRGLDPDDPAQQPLPYGRNLLVVLGLVWTVTAALALRRAIHARSAVPGEPAADALAPGAPSPGAPSAGAPSAGAPASGAPSAGAPSAGGPPRTAG